MQVAHVQFRNRVFLARKLAHVMQCLEVIDGLKVVFERLAANGDAFLATSVVSTALSVLPSMAFDV